MDRVVVTKPVVGICHMQVCAAKDATDEEILREANLKNPSGTSGGWCGVVRGKRGGPVQCADDPDRIHYLISC